MFRKLFFAGVVGAVALSVSLVSPTTAQAGHRGGRCGGYRGFGAYYGNGGHDLYPHWHRTYTPFGSNSWYGNGPHDLRPHGHTYTPYSYRGYSFSPWGATQSFYPRTPYGW